MQPVYQGHGWKKSVAGQYSHRRSGRKRPKGEWLKNLFLLAIVLFISGSLVVLGLFAYVSRDLPDPNTLTERAIQQSTKIYDRTGEYLLYDIYGEENRTLVKMQEGFCKDDPELIMDSAGIPLSALQATIAAEDRTDLGGEV